MSLNKPISLVTYASDSETIRAIIDANIDAIILEDSKLSSRSFYNDFNTDNFDKIKDLSVLARKLNPLIKLSFNLDLLIHDNHFPIIDKLIQTLKIANINTVRIQDTGLIDYFTCKYPEFKIQLAFETGVSNLESIKFLTVNSCARNIDQILLSNELSIKNIIDIINSNLSKFEFQVHGKVLLQYSHRRLLAAIENELLNATPLHRLVQDISRKELFFNAEDNPHGHFLFHPHQKCLLSEIPRLINSNLDSFLIDLRGESLNYLSATIKTYKTEINLYAKGSDSWALSYASHDFIKKHENNSFTKCFFNENNTDSEGPHSFKLEHSDFIGTILDVIKLKSTVIELVAPLKLGDTILIKNPYDKLIRYTISNMKNIWNESIETSLNHTLIKLPWIKGTLPESIVMRKSPQEG